MLLTSLTMAQGNGLFSSLLVRLSQEGDIVLGVFFFLCSLPPDSFSAAEEVRAATTMDGTLLAAVGLSGFPEDTGNGSEFEWESVVNSVSDDKSA